MRQTAKSIANNVGLFHQNLFKAVKGCDIPKVGWDVEFKNNNVNIFVEIKNKHNTMNSSSSQKTFIKAQSKISENSNNEVWLAEVISKKQGNNIWNISLDGSPISDERIRRVSIDYMWYIATGHKNSFYEIWDFISILLNKKEYQILNNKIIEKNIKNILNSFSGKKDGEKIESLAKETFKNYFGWKNLR